MLRTRPRRGTNKVVLIALVVLIPIAALIVWMMVCYLVKARENSKSIFSSARARQIVHAAYDQQQDRNDEMFVISTDELIAEGYLDPAALISPYGPVSDGRGDYWIYPDPIDEEGIADPSMLLILYDRAMYESDDYVAVAFLDGDATVIFPGELDQLIAQPPNGAVDYDLPARQP